MVPSDPYDLFFTGKDDPRHGCIMIGHVGRDERPVYFSFNTQKLAIESDAKTLIDNGRDIVAVMTWAMGTHLGTYAVGNRQPDMMTHLYMAGSSPYGHTFQTSQGRRFEWRKLEPDTYDLLSCADGQRLAGFRRFLQPKETPIGPAYATFQYTFDDDELMIYALLALSVNRWIDWHGF